MRKPGRRSQCRPTLPTQIQRRLERLYGVEAPNVDAFVCSSDEPREVLEVRTPRGAIEIRLHLPRAALDGAPLSLDELCQVAEGVSHFLYLAERARRELPATQLELELQAEVDKFLLLSAPLTTQRGETAIVDRFSGPRLRERLFENVRYLHPEGTESGDRYRFANQLAGRFAFKLERALSRGVERRSIRRTLRAFFAAGQREKIEMVLAA